MTGRSDNYTATSQARALMRQLGQNVKALRQARGWSLLELSKRSDIRYRTLENIEQEKNAPSFVLVVWLAEVFDVTMTQLVHSPLIVVDGRVKSPLDGRFVVPGEHSEAGTSRDRAANTTKSSK